MCSYRDQRMAFRNDVRVAEACRSAFEDSEVCAAKVYISELLLYS